MICHLAAGALIPYPYEMESNMKLEGSNGCLKLTTGKKQVDADRFTCHPWGLHMCLIFQI